MKPKAMNHYLKPFQHAVFFFNLFSLPHLMAQITEELTKSIVPPASLFQTLWLFGRMRV